jgi:hypothetical protein
MKPIHRCVSFQIQELHNLYENLRKQCLQLKPVQLNLHMSCRFVIVHLHAVWLVEPFAPLLSVHGLDFQTCLAGSRIQKLDLLIEYVPKVQTLEAVVMARRHHTFLLLTKHKRSEGQFSHCQPLYVVNEFLMFDQMMVQTAEQTMLDTIVDNSEALSLLLELCL